MDNQGADSAKLLLRTRCKRVMEKLRAKIRDRSGSLSPKQLATQSQKKGESILGPVSGRTKLLNYIRENRISEMQEMNKSGNNDSIAVKQNVKSSRHVKFSDQLIVNQPVAAAEKRLPKMIGSLLRKRAELSPYLATCVFESLNIDREILVGISAMNLTAPTRVQEVLIPSLLQDPAINIWAITNPGSGKTIAYSIAVLSRIDVSKDFVQAVCVVASTEVAYQTCILMAKLGTYKNVKIGVAANKDGVFMMRRDCHILIGTYKEVVSMGLLRIFNSKQITMAVFDDADIVATYKLLKEHFLNRLSPECQKIFLSSVQQQTPIDNVVEFKLLVDSNLLPPNISHHVLKCDGITEKENVVDLLYAEAHQNHANGKIVVFFNKKDTAHEMWMKYKAKGYLVSLLCSVLSIEDRLEELKRFCDGSTMVLFATDFASRSIDLPNSRIVVNFDVAVGKNPNEPCYKVYLQRISRVGRLGRHGMAINLVHSQSLRLCQNIANYYGFTMNNIHF